MRSIGWFGVVSVFHDSDGKHFVELFWLFGYSEELFADTEDVYSDFGFGCLDIFGGKIYDDLYADFVGFDLGSAVFVGLDLVSATG